MKRRRKYTKNLLVKSNDYKMEVVDEKKKIIQVLDGAQIVDKRFTQKGDLAMNYEDD